MSSRFMTTVMCDDVRREEGNKISYMGIYGPTLLVPQLPIALPKLCFVMSVICPGSEPPPKALAFRLLKNDEVMSEIVIPEEALAAAPRQMVGNADPGRMVFSAVVQVFPLQLEEPCNLRARALCDGEELMGGSWSVDVLQ